MRLSRALVLHTQRHLKWPALDMLEATTMILCGVALAGFTLSVFCDVVTRTIGHPWLWLQEVTSTFFVYGIFIGAAAATRRSDHLYLSAIVEKMRGRLRLVVEIFNRLIVLGVALCMTWFGYINFLQGFGNYRMPSMTPRCSSTQAARTPVPLYHPSGHCQRAAQAQSRRPSRAPAQEPPARRHHPYRDVAVGFHAALERHWSRARGCI